ncbi:dihydrolipoyl dehydrogenase [Pediococcus pentosaceus]|uniref:dihydrolipoyl dehydrogenase n=1 Tax=Pediococcus pentosaceus TaxID=1255 RepID=UPI000D00A26D|nr:dihydrolipoyl dehydrogenase [Pediococcus pentosaceus]AVL02198.1 dihydrolipoyl dehydrogenase [Pediococcus pentosaceus]MBF7130061.1 dihydrolipoyl dehydrogenase [Pediococcus pentosaceus]MBF7134269.1 dihydrolipoyl dehydrogenase [Pediococcus pentosaceus]MBF7135862.1 dihydrolipoyl dehydrogenase [Pediococcus pentosaceus]QPT36324.1 dihydrolipoyl dehydrogenase [Pediococcus pentosaceus]
MVVGTQAINVDTLIIGSGPGGYVAAIRAAELGQKVVIVERDYIGGVCLNVGCIPSKALIQAGHLYSTLQHGNPFGVSVPESKIDFTKTQEWKQNQVVNKLTGGVELLLKKHKVEIVRGEAYFNDNETVNVINGDDSHVYRFKRALIATGSRPVEIPHFKFSGRVIDSTGALNLKDVPEHLIIIGGGVIGAELAGAYMNLGSKITIIEGLDHILNGFDGELIQPVLNNFKKNGVEIVTEATAVEANQTDKDVTVTYEADGTTKTVTGDYCLVSVGRRPNTDQLGLNNTNIKLSKRGLIEVNDSMQTSVKHIYAIGDVVAGPALAHKASFEAKVAAAAMGGEDAHDTHYVLPAVAYTNIELATVGETPQSIAEKKLDAKSSKFPFAASGRAMTMDQTEGFIRLITDNPTGGIIGAQIVGPEASNLISELTLAIENGLTIKDIELTIHPHPTLGEEIMDAAELAAGLPIHV